MSKELKKIVISFSRKKQIQEDSLVRLIDVLTGCNCQIFASELLEVRFPEQQRFFPQLKNLSKCRYLFAR